MTSFLTRLLSFVCLLLPCAAGSWFNEVAEDVFRVIGSHLSFKDQSRSLRGINKRGNGLFHVFNNKSIQKVTTIRNRMTFFLNRIQSVPRNTAVFTLHRFLMLNEEYSLQWMRILKEQFGKGLQFSDPISLQCNVELSRILPSSPLVARIRVVYPDYKSPYDLNAYLALSDPEQYLVQLSRGITYSTLLLAPIDAIERYMFSLRQLTMEYLYCWEYLHSLNILPNRRHVFDDEAIHSKSVQMVNLRHFISKCGLMVIHPKHIESSLDSNCSGMEMWLCMTGMRRTLLDEERKTKQVHEMNARWLIGTFEKLKIQGYRWNLVLNRKREINEMLAILSETINGTDSNTQEILKEHVQELQAIESFE